MTTENVNNCRNNILCIVIFTRSKNIILFLLFSFIANDYVSILIWQFGVLLKKKKLQNLFCVNIKTLHNTKNNILLI